jgi:hypothetical protein
MKSSGVWKLRRGAAVAPVAGTRIVAEAVHKDVFHPVRALRQFALCLSNQQSLAASASQPAGPGCSWISI